MLSRQGPALHVNGSFLKSYDGEEARGLLINHSILTDLTIDVNAKEFINDKVLSIDLDSVPIFSKKTSFLRDTVLFKNFLI